ncbi:hypothetical protein Trydic_g8775 [Trypoxylus dichotomus]
MEKSSARNERSPEWRRATCERSAKSVRKSVSIGVPLVLFYPSGESERLYKRVVGDAKESLVKLAVETETDLLTVHCGDEANKYTGGNSLMERDLAVRLLNAVQLQTLLQITGTWNNTRIDSLRVITDFTPLGLYLKTEAMSAHSLWQPKEFVGHRL